jgi:hypothetical protein
MVVGDFEAYLKEAGWTVELATAGGHAFLVVRAMPITGGSHKGEERDVGILRSTETPWVPQAAVHVRPHVVPMGQFNSQASPLGSDWQYLSRRFDRPPTPRSLLAHIFTVLSEH